LSSYSGRVRRDSPVRRELRGTVSLREGDISGDSVSLTPSEAKPVLDAISAASYRGLKKPPITSTVSIAWFLDDRTPAVAIR
jgi:hypothetical protein